MSYSYGEHHLAVQPEPKDLGSFLDIGVEQRSKIYCYNVQIDDDVAYDDGVDQALETLNWEANRAVVDLIFTQTRHLRNSRNLYYVYDGERKMYTNQKHGLPEIDENGQNKAIYKLHAGVPMEDMITPPLIRDRANVHAADPEIPPFVARFFRCNEVMVTFTYDGEIDMANIGDALAPDSEGKDLNDKLRAFFYWLMVESVFESTANRSHYPSGRDTIFAAPDGEGEETLVDDIFAIREGLFIEPRITGKPDDVSTMLAAQPQYAAFYIEQSLAECWEKLMSNDALRFEFDTFFRGVRCKLEHDETLSVVVEGLTRKNLRELNARDENGDPIPMAQVFREQYAGLNGDRPAVRVCLHWPSAVRKHGSTVVREFAAYPLEALIIMPNQRVPLRQMSHTLAKTVVNKNLMARRDFKTLQRLLGPVLFSHSAIDTLRAFGVTVSNAPKFFTITPLQHMSVAYWTNMSWKIKDDWSAEAMRLKYFQPSIIPLLLIVVDNAVKVEHRNVDASVNNFRKELLETARAKEVQIQRAEIVFVDGIPDLMKRAKDDFKEVSLVIYVDKDFQWHGRIKLWERSHETRTLHVTIGTVSRKQRNDIDKIVAKSNVKTGGLCYKPIIRALLPQPPVFIMGLALTVTQPATDMQRSALNNTPSAVAVPERNALPSVIGVCANRATDTFKYSGDYDFQKGFNDGIIERDLLTDVSEWAFGRFLKNAGECQPPAIVFRYCQSESQFAKILDVERRRIEKGFVKATGGYVPKFALVLLTNEHAKHFRPNDAATAAVSVPGQAVGPGPAVFKGDQREFFMRPYRYDTVRNEKKKCDEKIPTKFTQYLVAHNTTHFTAEQLRDIAYALCYSRQSTAYPTQLPEPVHRALQLACRGRSNMEEFNKLRMYNANDLGAARNALNYRQAVDQELVNTCFTA